MTYEEQLIQKMNCGIELLQKEVGGNTINYIVGGSGSPVLLLHGATIGWGMWYKAIPELVKKFKVYALDLPGSGGSTKDDFRTSDLTARYVEVVESFIKSEQLFNWNVVGHSFGGWIALQLALRKNIAMRKQILIDSLGFTRHLPFKHRLATFFSLAKLLSKTAVKPDRTTMRKFLFEVFYDPAQGEELLFDYFYESLYRSRLSHPLLFMNSLGQWGRLRPELDMQKKLSELIVPTLVLWGEYDCSIPLFYSKMGISSIPELTLEIIPQTGHVPPLEQPEKVNQFMIRFLS